MMEIGVTSTWSYFQEQLDLYKKVKVHVLRPDGKTYCGIAVDEVGSTDQQTLNAWGDDVCSKCRHSMPEPPNP